MKNLEKATEEYIDAMYLINMNDYDECMKGSPTNVMKVLKKLNSEQAKLMH